MNNKELIKEISKKFLLKSEGKLKSMRENDYSNMGYILLNYTADDEGFDIAQEHVETLLDQVHASGSKINEGTSAQNDYRKKVLNKYCNDKVYGILLEPLEDSEFIGFSPEEARMKALIGTKLKNVLKQTKTWLASDNQNFDEARETIQDILDDISISTAKHEKIPAIVVYLIKLLNRITGIEYSNGGSKNEVKGHVSRNLEKMVIDYDGGDRSKLEKEQKDSEKFEKAKPWPDFYRSLHPLGVYENESKIITNLNEIIDLCESIRTSENKKHGSNWLVNAAKNTVATIKYRTGQDPNSIWGLETAFNDLRASIHQAKPDLDKLKSILKNPGPPAEKLKPQERESIKNIIGQLENIKLYIKEYSKQKFDDTKEFQNERKQLIDKALHFTNKHLTKYTNLLQFYDEFETLF
jgi:hypothetical protein